jgi:hypothetical protein
MIPENMKSNILLILAEERADEMVKDGGKNIII